MSRDSLDPLRCHQYSVSNTVYLVFKKFIKLTVKFGGQNPSAGSTTLDLMDFPVLWEREGGVHIVDFQLF